MPQENETPGTLFIQATHLRVRWPNGDETTFPLKKEVVRIGRDSQSSDLAIPAEMSSISRRHLEIRKAGDEYIVSDLDSANGVTLNKVRIKAPTRLKNGDELRIGLADDNEEIVLRFVAGSEALLKQAAIRTHDIQTQTLGTQSEPQGNQPFLAVRWPNGGTSYYQFSQTVMIVGRAAEAQVRVPEALNFVSQRHFEIQQKDGGFFLRDLHSTNGTYLNNQRIPPDIQFSLHHNMVIRIGDEEFGVSVGITFHNPVEAQGLQDFQPAAPTAFHKSQTIVIGRSLDCEMVLDSLEVSRRHARIQQMGGKAWLEDLDSRNGTFVNGKAVKQVELHEGDLIQISSYLLVYQDGKITPYQSNGMRVDVEGLNKDVRTSKGKLRILDDIHLTVLPREFVAIVGSSGAGKSTLLNALIGYRPGQGNVRLNGQDFYAEYESFRSQLGFVPQSDILHTSLTVERALDYAARLRLPGNISRKERKGQIDAVLETVSMNTDTIRRTRIGNLSGGQRKRVSIAAELLADPKLIYLDEATSGLDPGLEKKLMHTLRRMADEGRTVVLITHATSNIVQTDHVAFLSQGRLIYFGPSQEALDFFGVEDFADIYGLIEQRGQEWQHIFQKEKPAQYQKNVLERAATLKVVPPQALPVPRFGVSDFFRQLFTLIQRNLSVLFSDPITLALMLLLFPVTATLQLVIAKPDILTGNLAILADPAAAARTMLASYVPLPGTNTFVFVMGLEAVLVGLYVPPNELIRERSIYLRERMVNLKVLPYLLSKVAVYTLFSAIQVVLYMLILSTGVKFPEHGLYLPGVPELFITLFLTMLAGIGTGMIVAAVSRSTDMAIYILVMLLFFQFFFAGTIFDLRGNKLEPMSYFTATRWSLNALGVTINMHKLAQSTILCNDVPVNPLDPSAGTRAQCFNYPDATKDLMLPYGNENLLRSWLVLAGMAVLTIGITGILLKRMEPAS